jgi:hypothetical protein
MNCTREEFMAAIDEVIATQPLNAPRVQKSTTNNARRPKDKNVPRR